MRTTKTTKLLALVLSLLMLFTMVPLSVSAGETTGTILDVAQNDENGNYYLTGNVKVTATYADKFTGTFDGRGFTVETSVPLFANVSGGTVKNLNVTGSTTGAAGVAILATGSVTFENVTSSVNITHTTSDFQSGIGGIVAKAVKSDAPDTSAEELVFINCTNSGNITATTTAANHMGGIIGYPESVPSLKIINCKNTVTGTLTAYVNCEVGGIAGRINKDVTKVLIDGCTNNGAIEMTINTLDGRYAGGIVAWIYNIADYNVTNCLNSGTVTSMSAKKDNAVRVAGIVGRVDNPGYIIGCGNVAVITAAHIASGIVGQTNGNATIAYCYNTGKIDAKNYASGILASGTTTMGGGSVIGCYNSGEISDVNVKNYRGQIVAFTGRTTCTLNNNFVITGDGVATAYAAHTASANEFDSGKLKTGELTFDMNKAIKDAGGETVYYQNINEGGATNDDHPVTDPTHGYVFDKDMDKELANGEELYSLAFYTLKTASVRLNADGVSGLRFATAVNKADYEVLTRAGISLDFGTLITPNDYLTDPAKANNVFTADALKEGNYLDVNSTATGDAVFNEYLKGADMDHSVYYYFCGSITGIKEANYDWDYSAIGYVTIKGTTVYSGQYATRNIQYVATAAYTDRQATSSGAYTNEIAANSDYAIGGVVSYSPYSTPELERIKVYL